MSFWIFQKPLAQKSTFELNENQILGRNFSSFDGWDLKWHRLLSNVTMVSEAYQQKKCPSNLHKSSIAKVAHKYFSPNFNDIILNIAEASDNLFSGEQNTTRVVASNMRKLILDFSMISGVWIFRLKNWNFHVQN